ncbi:MAG: hypothetical protein EOO42_09540 [Flavobacteriales bacterium]|nr:MAG: hypothetical protein EOO42_09540 [Flavobacteriales bacterium]
MKEFLEARKDILFHYSPYSFFPKADRDKIFDHSIIGNLDLLKNDPDVQFREFSIGEFKHIFVVKFLKWDTDYFKIPTYKLIYVLYSHNDYNTLKSAAKKFANEFFTQSGIYCFSEIPSEDIFTIQALNESGFKLVESRLTYYLELKKYDFKRFKVREASLADIPNLKRVAREMRNDYDRFHAETIFDLEKSDEFLATFIEESIKGFSDYTMVPAEEGVSPDAFLTANYLNTEWEKIGEKVSKMVLSAVSSDTCKGWYVKLISEMAYHLKSIGAEYAFMHPATTNRAVIRTYEKLGCKYGKCVHVLTYAS